MKAQIDIISGFLGSGKTAFINGILRSSLFSEEKVVVLQCEAGEEEIKTELINNKNIYIKNLSKEESLDSHFVKKIIEEYFPDRIIIEHNCMLKLEELLMKLEDHILMKICNINRIIHLIDSSSFHIFINNMGSILIEQISNSDLLIINNMAGSSKDTENKIRNQLKAINKSADIVGTIPDDELKLAVDYASIYKKKTNYFSTMSNKVFAAFSVLAFLYLIFSALKPADFDLFHIDPSRLQTFSTIFLSILIQAFPFILFGVFISSALQIFVPGEKIAKLFPADSSGSLGFAILAGFLFPVCDCAIIPVAARLAKKGVHFPAAVTFMLAAPIVNPIVIASTFYAFPGQYFIALSRLILGIAVAFAVGAIFSFFPEKESVFLDSIGNLTCKCGYCNEDYRAGKGIFKKTNAIFRHAGSEFFGVGRFLIMGAFLSSIMQTIIPKNNLAGLSGIDAASLLIMMALAFVLSVCSTSDAFIARSFTNQFSIESIMGFMVLGPMIDIKNLLMLLGSFKKKFVIKLVCVIFTVSFVIIYLFTLIYF